MNDSPPGPVTVADQIMAAWGQHISDPDKGQHRHQILTDVRVYTDRWTGRIIAPAGASVNVSKDTVSSVYRVNPGWITIEHGDHAGEALITVSYFEPAEMDPTTLEGAWKKRVSRTGGPMPKTHLEDVTDDPNTEERPPGSSPTRTSTPSRPPTSPTSQAPCASHPC
ncbi:hypothetical protein [Streptomyces scabiei]|uniref:hypothetical protein n=1 Tax=Streptomyces scabiei TaxID=1930 RepID=UPI001FF1DDE3|nr:hypothetical protein [Streptomyces sp. LBUM 1486]